MACSPCSAQSGFEGFMAYSPCSAQSKDSEYAVPIHLLVGAFTLACVLLLLPGPLIHLAQPSHFGHFGI